MLTFHGKFLLQEKWLCHGSDMSCAKSMQNEEKQFIGTASVKQASRAMAQMSTYDHVTFFMHIHHGQLIRQDVKMIL
jgi:hypothetical protein